MLNELEKSYLNRFVEDEGLASSVKRALKVGALRYLPAIRDTDSDELIGQKFRGYEEALRLIDSIFVDLEEYKRSSNKKNNLPNER